MEISLISLRERAFGKNDWPPWIAMLAISEVSQALARPIDRRSIKPADPLRQVTSSGPVTAPLGAGKPPRSWLTCYRRRSSLELRHIFVVLPYTNIVQQSVDTYRKALVLPGEDPEKIVAAHHHQAEFSSADLRFLTTLWDAPIVVTTAVQFFETLGANQTIRLRKLHQLPGSAVFVDEAHAAMPIHLWPFMWDQIRSLTREWRCRFVLGSGSLAKFWENPRIFGEGKIEKLPTMIPDQIRAASTVFEQSRVVYRSRPDALTMATLCDWIQTITGPRLVVLNTVQSAAVVASELRRRGVLTLHLSTALAPIHRKIILRLIRLRLKIKPQLDWVFVATSCVEAGVDFSFGMAFRERCRTSSIVQIGGRVNRHGERPDGVVWDFIVNDPLLTLHPDFKHSRDVVEDIFRKGMWNQDLTTLMTYALEQEFKRQSGGQKIDELFQKEAVGSYPRVAELTRLINSDTRPVVIDARLIDAIRDGARIDRRELLARSVQLWFSKIGNSLSSQSAMARNSMLGDMSMTRNFWGLWRGSSNWARSIATAMPLSDISVLRRRPPTALRPPAPRLLRAPVGAIHIEQLWEESRLTAEGQVLHERAHDAGSESVPVSASLGGCGCIRSRLACWARPMWWSFAGARRSALPGEEGVAVHSRSNTSAAGPRRTGATRSSCAHRRCVSKRCSERLFRRAHSITARRDDGTM